MLLVTHLAVDGFFEHKRSCYVVLFVGVLINQQLTSFFEHKDHVVLFAGVFMKSAVDGFFSNSCCFLAKLFISSG